ncbi:hypothetical protein COA17_12980 [Sphingomonas ginsenosidimutans]|jgi:hypothetical protein|uniref:DUF3325 domain-containing protein n=1 Tax=Sphingomonas ginsenosidimutans TaxID=862134 RepID=A0A2A4HXE9_9SPHN|nr:hypothetical protein [Sphingomonas ginsenosidimutans]PCG08579.1 hypothetical protein COA17_12980 [Sphingomonas ginsenosidimutans]
MIAAWCAPAAIVGGAMCLYAGTRHQALIRPGVAARPCRIVGTLLLLLALALLLTVHGPATAVFTWATIAMLVWSIAPVAIGWWRFRRGAAR